MRHISFYCKSDVPGWVRIPNQLLSISDDFMSFLRESDGIQIICSIKNYSGKLPMIHISLGPVKYYRPKLSDKEFVEEILNKAASIFQEFFGELVFMRAPDDPVKPNVKHFFSILDRVIPKFSEN